MVYTNIGLEAGQHRLLKHLAVEERRGLAELVREAVASYLAMKRKPAPAYEDDFLFQMGRTWRMNPDRPYRPGDWGQADRDLYGGSPHGDG